MRETRCASACGPTLHWRDTHKATMKKISDNVYLINGSTPVHDCGEREPSFLIVMTQRDNKDGIIYGCTTCEHTVDEGVSMAIRLNEVDI